MNPVCLVILQVPCQNDLTYERGNKTIDQSFILVGLNCCRVETNNLQRSIAQDTLRFGKELTRVNHDSKGLIFTILDQ